MRKRPIQVFLDNRDRALLEALAEREGMSLAETLRQAIRHWAREANAADDPLLRLIGSIDEAHLPEDLSTRHDEYAVARRTDEQGGDRKRRARKAG
jgi:hypothetical protein